MIQEYIPYVYLLKNKTTGLCYLGVRYSKRQIANPSDFWVSYFTSSKLVQKLRETFGDRDFSYRILHKFPNDPEKAILKEAQYFPIIQKKDHYLNLCYSSGCLDLRTNSKAGKVGGQITSNKKLGIHGGTKQQRSKWGSKGGNGGGWLKQIKENSGIHCYNNPELRKEWASQGGQNSPVFKDSKRQSEFGKRGGPQNKGFRWYHDNKKSYKYTRKEQMKKSFDVFIAENNQFEAGRLQTHIKVQCPHCLKTGYKGAMVLHHFQNCKENKNANQTN